MKTYDLNIEKSEEGWRISAMRKGYRVHKLYVFYTRTQAVRAFLKEYGTE